MYKAIKQKYDKEVNAQIAKRLNTVTGKYEKAVDNFENKINSEKWLDDLIERIRNKQLNK